MLSTTAKPYIDASVPVLREHGLAITTTFYQNMLTAHPELKNIFNLGNQANGSQQLSLASAVFAYAANIENQSALAPVIERIVHKHASVGIKPSHYPIVGRYLLGAIKSVLGDAATPDLIAAWDEAYWLLAGELIAAEAKLYQSKGIAADAWLKMKVIEITPQSEDIFSLTLVPHGHDTLPEFKPGQYISVATYLEDMNVRQIRQYSLSDGPNKTTLRISIKRERAENSKPDGQISNWLHNNIKIGSVLDVSYPFGNFTPDIAAAKPIVLISAGVGITPMISILKAITHQNPERSILFAHSARSVNALAHKDDIQWSLSRLHNLKTKLYLNETPADDGKFIHGLVNLTDIVTDDYMEGEFYICGPISFMNDQWKVLLALGVNPEKIHREVFGPESLNHLL